MSYKNLKLNLWSRDGMTRLYIDTKYVEGRNVMSYCNGDWIEPTEDGQLKFGYKTRYARYEEAALGREEVMNCITFDGRDTLTWTELLERIESCKTKGGNFSFSQYEKRYGSQ